MINELVFDNQFNGTSLFTVIEWGTLTIVCESKGTEC